MRKKFEAVVFALGLLMVLILMTPVFAVLILVDWLSPMDGYRLTAKEHFDESDGDAAEEE
jgi:hypothetical protein